MSHRTRLGDTVLLAASLFTSTSCERAAPTPDASSGPVSEQLAGHYHNDALGDIDVRRTSGRTVFDFGEFRSDVATRVNPDGSISFVTIDPGIDGFGFVVDDGAEKTLTIRDAQHEYVFTGS
jgi:hypothetical protein